MAMPTPRQLEQLFRLIGQRRITSLHVQFLLDGRHNIDDVLLHVQYYAAQIQPRYKYDAIDFDVLPGHFWSRWHEDVERPVKLGFLPIERSVSIHLARAMLHEQMGHAAPDIAESEAFFTEHPEMLEDGPIVALCGNPGRDSTGHHLGMALIEAKVGHVQLVWKLDSDKLPKGTRLLVVHL